jgi:hypothetical protein
MMLAIVVCVLVAAGAIGFTLTVREKDIPPAPVENPELKHLETQRQVVYDNLKDLQFEYHQGKLSEDDYQSLKQGFLYELASVMDAIEKTQRGNVAVTKQAVTTSKRASPATRSAVAERPPEAQCPACAFANPSGNRFCGQCGAAIS